METKTTNNPALYHINKPVYVVFLLMGIYFILNKNLSDAIIFWGLALVFDPFNVKIPFPKRPLYQRAWLIVHLVITFTLIGIELVQ